MARLLDVDDAIRRILARFQQLPAEVISLENGLGRVLAEDVYADTPLPPFDNSSMDGYAVRAEDLIEASQENPVTLALSMDIRAGDAPEGALQAGQAARIMTGAPLPTGADSVVPVEVTDGDWEKANDVPLPPHVQVFKSVQAGDYVRPAGEDMRQGQQILTRGMLLRPQEIGVLAALGQADVPVVRRPIVALISSGDELIAVDQPLTPGKIRDVNRYTLSNLVTQYGGQPVILPTAQDTLESVRETFQQALAQQPDIIISSGGASVGTADFVYMVLQELGTVDFWKINLRPGKPLAFGQVGGVPFFGLPGNPVSAMVTFDVLVRPALLELAARPDDWHVIDVTLGESLLSDGRRSYLRVKLNYDAQGRAIATTTGTQSSGALMSMVLADALMIIPAGTTHLDAGTSLKARLLR